MILLSSLLVAIAAVLLVFGFVDGLAPIYGSIVACVLALLLLVVASLRRRREEHALAGPRHPAGVDGDGGDAAPSDQVTADPVASSPPEERPTADG